MLNKLKAVGCDLDEAYERMLENESLLERFIIKFSKDTSMQQLSDAMTSGNYACAFEHAHSLKGLSGSLGLSTIYKPGSVLVEKLRYCDYKDIDKYYDDVCKGYFNTIGIIKSYLTD